ncbi:MAG: aminotransferase class V-fold PLP-dependent enzyme [Cyanobacteriota bacterium]|nr:aminotransferase class V-fold PLP-dependent enzyme [Cyanobacteriota bacterium]
MASPQALPLRDRLPALAGKTYFNYGGQGPLPSPSLDAIVAAWRTIQEQGPFSSAVGPFLSATVSGLRQRLASEAWLGVPPQRLSFTENVTSGCLLPLWGLPWQQGDELLISDAEHPGVLAGLQELAQREGLHCRSLPVRELRGDPSATEAASIAATEAAVLEALERALSPRTRLVALSHLLWNTGQLMPISAVAARLAEHPARPWLLVDAAQSLGSIPVAEAAAASDLYACTGHKWCCGPEGLGVVALSDRLLQEARPTMIGWRSLADEDHIGSGAPRFHADGRRFEVATSCTPLFAGLARSLELLEAEGSAEERLQRIRASSRALWEGLQAIPGVKPLLAVPPPAGLVSFTAGSASVSPSSVSSGMSGGSGVSSSLSGGASESLAPEALVRSLGERGIWLRSLPDPSCLRACTHLTTTPADLAILLAALRELLAA